MLVLVKIIVVVGMLVVVPAGLRLLDVPALVRRLWLAGAAAGALSLCLPRGPLAVAAACVYAAATLMLGVQAVRRLPPRDLGELAMITALGMPAVAGTALVAERAGYELFGFSTKIMVLTVAHFHFAGFAAALIAGLLCRAAHESRPAQVAALSVPGGTLLVLAGYFTGDWVEFAGTAVLTAGMWLVGWLTWRDVRSPDRTTRVLLVVSSAVLAGTMALALSWALGEASGLPHPSLGWMAATHGAGNALGFALCGLLAWQRLRKDTLWT